MPKLFMATCVNNLTTKSCPKRNGEENHKEMRNERPMGHIAYLLAYLSNKSQNKIIFIESFYKISKQCSRTCEMFKKISIDLHQTLSLGGA